MNGPVTRSELVYFASDLALVTSQRVVLAGQTFETARIRNSRISSESPTHHELHVDVDGLEMIGLTVSVWGWLYPIDQAILHARLGHTHLAAPYVAPPPPPPPPAQPRPLPPSEWGTPLWNPGWMHPWDGHSPYLVPRPKTWPRFAFLATWLALIVLGVMVVLSSGARHLLVDIAIRIPKPAFFVWAPLLAFHLGWVHYAWGAIPPECRRTGSGRWITISSASRYFLVPVYALYWAFIAHVGVAEATNSVLASYGSQRRASTALPWAACILFLLPGPNVILAPLVLVLHMFDCDAAQAGMLEHLSKGPPTVHALAPPEESRLRFAWLVVLGPWIALVTVAFVVTSLANRETKESRSAELERIADAYASNYAACVEKTPFDQGTPRWADAEVTCNLRVAMSESCRERSCYFAKSPDDPFKGKVEISDLGRPYRATRVLRCAEGRCAIAK